MKKRLWQVFWTLQIIGLVCLSGGESFAITRFGFACRVIALVVLEPGFILMESLAEKALWETSLTLSQIYWLGVLGGVAFNALFLVVLLSSFNALRRKKAS